MSTLANSEDLEEMPYNAVFHQDLHCLLRQKQFSEKEVKFYLKFITCVKGYVNIFTFPL